MIGQLMILKRILEWRNLSPILPSVTPLTDLCFYRGCVYRSLISDLTQSDKFHGFYGEEEQIATEAQLTYV